VVALALAALPALPTIPSAFQPVANADSSAGAAPTADSLGQPDVAGVAVSVVEAPFGAALDATETPLELALLNLLNADRAANGLPALAFDASLLPVARARAEAQKPLPSLSHWDPDGQLAFVKLLSADGVDYQLAGENLARLTGPDNATATRAEDALMHSPTHRANILEPTFNRVAIGATTDGTGRVIFAQIFRNKAA
jgi:uncharacterized protein YkwD